MPTLHKQRERTNTLPTTPTMKTHTTRMPRTQEHPRPQVPSQIISQIRMTTHRIQDVLTHPPTSHDSRSSLATTHPQEKEHHPPCHTSAHEEKDAQENRKREPATSDDYPTKTPSPASPHHDAICAEDAPPYQNEHSPLEPKAVPPRPHPARTTAPIRTPAQQKSSLPSIARLLQTYPHIPQKHHATTPLQKHLPHHTKMLGPTRSTTLHTTMEIHTTTNTLPHQLHPHNHHPPLHTSHLPQSLPPQLQMKIPSVFNTTA